MSNKDIVLFALFELGGAKEPIHTEDIANKIFSYPIGKKIYRWEKYEYPDKERVARELRRLKNWQGISYVKGHVNIGAQKNRIDGWALTAAGVERVKILEDRLGKLVQVSQNTNLIYATEDIRRQLKESKCFILYKKDPLLSRAKDHDFTDMLYCLPDAPYEKIQSEFDKLLASARAVEASDIVEFLENLAKRFNHLLNKI